MAVVGYATVQLIPSMNGFSANARGQMAPVVRTIGTESGKQAGGLFGGSFLGSVGKIMAAAGIYEIGSRVASGFTDAIATGLKGFANLQTYTTSFKTLLGSASAADDMIRNLYDFAAKTPFDVEGSVVGAQKLLGVNVAAKDVIPTLTTLGDATAALGGTTGDFNSVLLAYSQIMARGKVSTQDLYQISNTGIPIFQLMSEALGKPVGEIQKLIETGQLASDDVLPKLLAVMNENYGGAMADQAQNLSGLWSTFKDTMSQVLTQALTPVGEWLIDILPGATTAAQGAIEFLQGKFTDFAQAIGETDLGDSLQPLIQAFQDTDWSGIADFIINAFASIAQGVSPVVESLSNFVLDVLPPLGDLLGTLGDNMATNSESMSNSAGKMGEASQTASDASTSIQDSFAGLGTIGDQLRGLTAVTDFAGPIVGGMIQIVNAFFQGRSAIQIFNGALNGEFGSALQTGAQGISQFALTVGVKMAAVAAAGISGMVRLGAAVISGVANALGTVRNGFGQIVVAAASGMERFVGAVGEKIGQVSVTIGVGLSNAYSAITGYFGTFASAGSALIGGFVEGIRAKFREAVSAVQAGMAAVANFFPHSPAPKGPFSGRGWTLYSGRSLVDGFAQGIGQRRGSLASLMQDTFTVPGSALSGPASSVVGEVSAAVGARGGAYIGSTTVNTTNGNEGVIDELAFLLRTLNRGGR